MAWASRKRSFLEDPNPLCHGSASAGDQKSRSHQPVCPRRWSSARSSKPPAAFSAGSSNWDRRVWPEAVRGRGMDSVRIVEEFWSAVWKAQNPVAAANFILDDFLTTTARLQLRGKGPFAGRL